jgi:hypothetical protein
MPFGLRPDFVKEIELTHSPGLTPPSSQYFLRAAARFFRFDFFSFLGDPISASAVLASYRAR